MRKCFTLWTSLLPTSGLSYSGTWISGQEMGHCSSWTSAYEFLPNLGNWWKKENQVWLELKEAWVADWEVFGNQHFVLPSLRSPHFLVGRIQGPCHEPWVWPQRTLLWNRYFARTLALIRFILSYKPEEKNLNHLNETRGLWPLKYSLSNKPFFQSLCLDSPWTEKQELKT